MSILAAAMPKHKSVILPDNVVAQVLDDNVPLSACSPNKLFKVKENKNGLTSNLTVCVKFQAVLSAVLDATQGKQLTSFPETASGLASKSKL